MDGPASGQQQAICLRLRAVYLAHERRGACSALETTGEKKAPEGAFSGLLPSGFGR
jgi:hypothetical protein